MNFRRHLPIADDTFQLAPLIDTVFILLTFFIATWASASEEREALIQLPKTSNVTQRRQEKTDVVVNLRQTGQILVNGEACSSEALRGRLTQIVKESRAVSVIIRADRKTAYEDVVKVLDACIGAQVKAVSFVSVNASTPDNN